MTANITQVSEGLAGKGATNVKLYFDQLQVKINNAITSGDLTKFTPPSSLTSGPGAPSSQPASSQAHPPEEKRYKCDQCECRGITRIHQSPSRLRPSMRPTAAFINIHEHPL